MSPTLSPDPPRCDQCSGNTEQGGDTGIFKAGGRILAFHSAKHPDGLLGCKTLRLKLHRGGEGRTWRDREARNSGKNVVLAEAAGRGGDVGDGGKEGRQREPREPEREGLKPTQPRGGLGRRLAWEPQR